MAGRCHVVLRHRPGETFFNSNFSILFLGPCPAVLVFMGLSGVLVYSGDYRKVIVVFWLLFSFISCQIFRSFLHVVAPSSVTVSFWLLYDFRIGSDRNVARGIRA